MKYLSFIRSHQRKRQAQALAEVAVFGAILIFLIGVILRTHISSTQNQNHQVRAMKLALLQSFQSSQGIGARTPNNSRNSANILFVEDRLSPDFNKFNNIDRSPFTANGSGTMSNRLFYPVDFETYNTQPLGEVGYNLPIMDVFINGQHFPLTVASYVLRVLYADGETCPDDWVGTGQPCTSAAQCPVGLACSSEGRCRQHGAEYIRCKRQQAEMVAGKPMFYSLSVNGTEVFDENTGNFDLLRNDWDNAHITGIQDKCQDDVPGCSGTERCSARGSNALCKTMAWQWRSIEGTGANINAPASTSSTSIGFSSSNGDSSSPNYPQIDTSGSLREQTLYAVTQKPHNELLTILNDPAVVPFIINWNKEDQAAKKNRLLSLTPSLTRDCSACKTSGYDFTKPAELLGITRTPGPGPLTGVVVLDFQLGDIDNSYDKRATPGPQPGLMQQSEIYTQVREGTYLQIKEGKLYNPETHAVVRSVSSKDHVDLITRYIQLSNNTGRFCVANSNGVYTAPLTLADQDGEANPVKACAQTAGGCMQGENFQKTCYDPFQRIIYVRTNVGEKTTRKWYTDVTKGL